MSLRLKMRCLLQPTVSNNVKLNAVAPEAWLRHLFPVPVLDVSAKHTRCNQCVCRFDDALKAARNVFDLPAFFVSNLFAFHSAAGTGSLLGGQFIHSGGDGKIFKAGQSPASLEHCDYSTVLGLPHFLLSMRRGASSGSHAHGAAGMVGQEMYWRMSARSDVETVLAIGRPCHDAAARETARETARNRTLESPEQPRDCAEGEFTSLSSMSLMSIVANLVFMRLANVKDSIRN